MQVKDIVIVGGGSSGWMTAAALDVLCPHVNVTLIEDPNQGVIGCLLYTSPSPRD